MNPQSAIRNPQSLSPFDVISIDFFAPCREPVVRRLGINEFDGRSRTACHASGIAAAQIALRRGVIDRRCKNRAIGTSDRAKMTADAQLIQDHLRASRLIDRNGIDRTSGHAPRFVTLQTSEGRITGLFVKDVDTNQAAGRLEAASLHPGTGQFALHAARTSIRHDLQ
jgi:hypothetical protein